VVTPGAVGVFLALPECCRRPEGRERPPKQSILDRRPTESTERSLRRSRRTRLLIVFGIARAASAVMAVIVLLVLDVHPAALPDDSAA
jgi:hypothetical protein